MTEYDFSPEAQNRHIHKMNGIARWRDDISSIRPADPHKPATPAPRRSTTMPDDHIYSARNISSRTLVDRGRSHKPSSKSDSSRHRRQVSVPAVRYPSPPPAPPPPPQLRYAVQPPPRVQPVRAMTYQHPPPGIQQPYQNPTRSRTVVPTPSQGYSVQYVNPGQTYHPTGYYGPKTPPPVVKPSTPIYFPPQQKTGFFSKLTGMFGSNRGSDVIVTRRKSSKSSGTQHRSHRSRRSSW